jgi:threonine dehydratase
MQEHLEGGLVVSEEQVLQAMARCMQNLKVVVEPGGCAGLAALFAGLLPTQNKTTLVILSGGNADPDILARSLEHN